MHTILGVLLFCESFLLCVTCVFICSRSRRDYWEHLLPASGRPKCPSLSTPEGWGVTKGHADLLQHKEATSTQEMKHVLEMQKKTKPSVWARQSEKAETPIPLIGQQERDERKGGKFPSSVWRLKKSTCNSDAPFVEYYQINPKTKNNKVCLLYFTT